MSRLEDTVKTIISDSVPPTNKDEYLASLVCERLKEKSRKYEERFDHYLEKIEKSTANGRDFDRTISTMKSLSDLTDKSYKDLLKLIKKFFS